MNKEEKAFYFVLLAAFAAAIWLMLPFVVALVLALVTVVVAWPLHIRIVRLFRGRRRLAAFATLVILTLAVFIPLSGLIWIVSRELIQMSTQVATSLGQEGGIQSILASLDTADAREWSERLTGDPTTFKTTAEGMLTGTVLGGAGSVTTIAANVLNVTTMALLNLLSFYIAAAGMLVGGTELLDWIKRISPLEDRYEDRLFAVFGQLSRNVVIAGFVSALVQGVVAGGGYAIAGVERWGIYAMLTGVMSLIPFIGCALIWVPLVIVLLARGDTWQALFLIGWSAVLTGGADNFVKPYIVRGGTQLPAVLVYLGGFGGLAWFGLIGILLGPVILAFLAALLTIYEERYLVPEVVPTGRTV